MNKLNNNVPMVKAEHVSMAASLMREIHAHISLPQYSLKDDERFKSADDVEETHVKTTDW